MQFAFVRVYMNIIITYEESKLWLQVINKSYRPGQKLPFDMPNVFLSAVEFPGDLFAWNLPLCEFAFVEFVSII